MIIGGKDVSSGETFEAVSGGSTGVPAKELNAVRTPRPASAAKPRIVPGSASAAYDLFLNASHGDLFAPRARRNALLVFFPQPLADDAEAKASITFVNLRDIGGRSPRGSDASVRFSRIDI